METLPIVDVASVALPLAEKDHLFGRDGADVGVRARRIVQRWAAPDAVAFAVHDDGRTVGAIWFTSVTPGADATGHYCFFDGLRAGMTETCRRAIWWAFDEWDLQRISCRIPDFAFPVALHASRRLGFGGPFRYERGGREIDVEGVLDFGDHEELLLGLLKGGAPWAAE